MYIYQLDADTSYEFVVMARDLHGDAHFSQTVKATTTGECTLDAHTVIAPDVHVQVHITAHTPNALYIGRLIVPVALCNGFRYSGLDMNRRTDFVHG